MAQIAHKEKFTFNRMPDEKPVMVGNNRHLELTREGMLNFYFHGHCIAQAFREESGGVSVYLDHCSYLTVTTCAAIKDFLKACRITASVSRAGKVFSGHYRNGKGEFVAMESGAVGSILLFHVSTDMGSRLC